jgi:hypothetical protein
VEELEAKLDKLVLQLREVVTQIAEAKTLMLLAPILNPEEPLTRKDP